MIIRTIMMIIRMIMIIQTISSPMLKLGRIIQTLQLNRNQKVDREVGQEDQVHGVKQQILLKNLGMQRLMLSMLLVKLQEVDKLEKSTFLEYYESFV